MIGLESGIRRHASLAIILTAISVAIGERTSTFKYGAATLTFGLRIPGAIGANV